jgi:hypothetical protein
MDRRRRASQARGCGREARRGSRQIGLKGKAAIKLRSSRCQRSQVRRAIGRRGRLHDQLVAKGDLVTAYVFDASGKAYAKGDLDLSLKLGAGAFVKLVWDAPSLAYRAKIEGDFDLDVAPIVVSVKAHGKAHVGLSAKVKAKANLNAKLDADVKGKAEAKAKAGAKVNVSAPKVKVTPPKVNVSVNKSASATAGTGAKAKGGFSIGTK